MISLVRVNTVEDNLNSIADLAIIPIEIVIGATCLEFQDSIIILNQDKINRDIIRIFRYKKR